MFREKYPIAWTYHRNTSRWPHNVHPVPDAPSPEPHFKEYLGTSLIELPSAVFPALTLEDAFAARLSCRHYRDKVVQLDRLSPVLKAAYGVWQESLLWESEFLHRPAPSGGGLYPLEIYLLARRVEGLPPGVYHYAPLFHALELVRELPLPPRYLTELFMGQHYVGEASLVVVLTAVLARSLWKYGDRGYRYILMEAGHVAQNINLVCPGLGLGSVNLGGFFDTELSRLLGLESDDEVCLYGMAIGVPDGTDPAALRLPTPSELPG
jgi:SagB-type dehydrogenase family enzyme